MKINSIMVDINTNIDNCMKFECTSYSN
jgi:hypothetical protein